jgi:bifunctional non-homologous end joining protein LigD
VFDILWLNGIDLREQALDQATGHTKRELVEYYAAIAEWALPHLHNRPLALVRAPDGLQGELFFQKHSERARIPGIEELPTEVHPRHPPLLVANTPEALVGLAQMSVLAYVVLDDMQQTLLQDFTMRRVDQRL